MVCHDNNWRCSFNHRSRCLTGHWYHGRWTPFISHNDANLVLDIFASQRSISSWNKRNDTAYFDTWPLNIENKGLQLLDFKASIQGHFGNEDFNLSYSSRITLFFLFLLGGKDCHHGLLAGGFISFASASISVFWPSFSEAESPVCLDNVKLLSGTYFRPFEARLKMNEKQLSVESCMHAYHTNSRTFFPSISLYFFNIQFFSLHK